ncbi:sugar ABC transporter ATP-binding protein [Brevibacillus choshinensis]|uniref:sugar ABC transporter ATP-binding protein n=1 Tax=Brevibacillus choshinensis TaxID=54911 RepID=UPI002E1F06CC|nr:sugar ABC transporter ATP-binding protein [Brevibacillus choshinensis]
MSVIEIRDISIEFPGVKALRDVTFTVEKGQVVALCGENGAGKSTLGKIIAGVNPFGTYTGAILYEGTELMLASTLEAEKLGIAIVHQELNLFNEMTVAENIFLSHLPNKAGVIHFEGLYKQAKELLDELGIPIQPNARIKDLPVSKRQMVEIAKAVAKKPKVLIFDEATSSLSNHEVSTLYGIMKRLKENGTTMIYVSHKLNEIFDICDAVVVLKDGCYVRSALVKETTKDDIIRWTVGRELIDLYPPRRKAGGSKEEWLRIEDWSVYNPSNTAHKLVDRVSLCVKTGEILGIYGLVGAGRTELVDSIFTGRDGNSSGKMYVQNKPIQIKNPAHAIASGIALVTEDRKKSGLVLGLSVEQNLTLASLHKVAKTLGTIDQVKADAYVQRMVQKLAVKVPNVKHLVKNLSGGNQQKVVVGKWLLTDPKLLILDEPTRGIDVGAKAEIYKMIRELADEGIAIIMVSSELPEVLGVSDRIIVMKDGKIAAEIPQELANEEALVRYALGGTQHVS